MLFLPALCEQPLLKRSCACLIMSVMPSTLNIEASLGEFLQCHMILMVTQQL